MNLPLMVFIIPSLNSCIIYSSDLSPLFSSIFLARVLTPNNRESPPSQGHFFAIIISLLLYYYIYFFLLYHYLDYLNLV
nr:MAG TPA: hypothetical protein [Caudoviricetes sp.]